MNNLFFIMNKLLWISYLLLWISYYEQAMCYYEWDVDFEKLSLYLGRKKEIDAFKKYDSKLTTEH